MRALQISGESGPEFRIDNSNDATSSPDGHWVAYSDDKDGQLYVTPFPGPGARIAISTEGGVEPHWRGDGQELFYATNDQNLVAVQVRESPSSFQVVSSAPLFRLALPSGVGFYDVTRDGRRFLVNNRTHLEQAAPLILVTDWRQLVQSEASRP